MGEQVLKAIEDRAAAADEGIWRIDFDPRQDGADQVLNRKGQTVCFMTTEDHRDGGVNAKFIAFARQDVPDLVAEVRRLQAELLAGRVEADNLAKMLSDSNAREELVLEASSNALEACRAGAAAMKLRKDYQAIERGAQEGEEEYFDRRRGVWDEVRAADRALEAALAKVQVPA